MASGHRHLAILADLLPHSPTATLSLGNKGSWGETGEEELAGMRGWDEPLAERKAEALSAFPSAMG
ncbi:hypothetical protein HRbin30_01869 [bacterium HR30]|nr:hypothetical protein HRbin30_01869 [bacterium HR30]